MRGCGRRPVGVVMEVREWEGHSKWDLGGCGRQGRMDETAVEGAR